MQRPGIELFGRADLHQLAQVHHRDAVAHVAHHAQVVGDEHVAHAAVAAQVLQQVEQLCLHRDVQPRHHLVADQQARREGERAGHRDALALAAGQFARPAAAIAGGIQANPFQHLGNPRLDAGPVPAAGDSQRFSDQVAHAPGGIERGEWILEDVLDLLPQAAQRGAVGVHQAGAVQQHIASGRPRALHDRTGQCRLAAAGFADQADAFAGCDGEADAGEGMDDARCGEW